jgi:hypothetical protein
MYDEDDELNENPLAEHDEWEQAIKDDGTLKPVNERYRIHQFTNSAPRVYCGTCKILLLHDPTYILTELLEVAKQHEAEDHS